MGREQKRCYVAWIGDDPSDGCEIWIAHSLKEAKKWAYISFNYDCDFIEVRVKWMRGIDVSDLACGFMSELTGVERGAYSWVYEHCSECGEYRQLFLSDELNEVMCLDCEDTKLKGANDG